MEGTGICECGCGGETPLSNLWQVRHNVMPKGWSRRNRYIKGHSEKNAHRIKAEIVLGHPIPKGVQVHHHGIPGSCRPDGIKDIVICENQKYHRFLHIREKAYFVSKGIECSE